jgi:hypothetical protein
MLTINLQDTNSSQECIHFWTPRDVNFSSVLSHALQERSSWGTSAHWCTITLLHYIIFSQNYFPFWVSCLKCQHYIMSKTIQVVSNATYCISRFISSYGYITFRSHFLRFLYLAHLIYPSPSEPSKNWFSSLSVTHPCVWFYITPFGCWVMSPVSLTHHKKNSSENMDRQLTALAQTGKKCKKVQHQCLAW